MAPEYLRRHFTLVYIFYFQEVTHMPHKIILHATYGTSIDVYSTIYGNFNFIKQT